MAVLGGWAVSYERGTPVVKVSLRGFILLRAPPQLGWNAHLRLIDALSLRLFHYFTEMCSGFEAGSYLRLIDCCITQL